MNYRIISTAFGYPIYAADIPGKPNIEISDRKEDAEITGCLARAKGRAEALTRLAGYKFEAVPCVS